ncbi:hemolymph lipopolysaccharide-binding protein-like [Periplaneta americana]|uniref:hemolymph lipopolysaccharide-binding protein-like n=1 Tax=Periplaneta americana TaxID=6978 RepID=UPI0037E99F05
MYIAVLCTLVWGTALTTASECTAIPPESFQLSINGYRNETGNWIAQVSMEQNEDMTPWAIDVSKTVKECSGSKSVLLTVTISEITGVYAEHPRSQSIVSPGKRDNVAASHSETQLQMLLLGYRQIPPFGFYKFHSLQETWNNAKTKCEQEGSHLIILNSREEFNAVHNEFHFTGYVHVGFHDKYEEGKYVTVLGESLNSTGYMNWARGKPEGTTIKNCGFVYSDGEIGDQKCTDSEQFVCERSV